MHEDPMQYRNIVTTSFSSSSSICGFLLLDIAFFLGFLNSAEEGMRWPDAVKAIDSSSSEVSVSVFTI